MRRLLVLLIVAIVVLGIVVMMTIAADGDAEVVDFIGPLLYMEKDGTIHPFADGDYPVLFGIYKTESGGEPIWVLEQMVTVKSSGKFEITLGPIDGSVFVRDETDLNDSGLRYLQYDHTDAIAMGRTPIVPSEYGTVATRTSLSKAAANPRPTPWVSEDTTGDTMFFMSADWYTQSQVRDLLNTIRAMQAKMDSMQISIDSMSP